MSDTNPNEVMQSAPGEMQGAPGEMQSPLGEMQSVLGDQPGAAGDPQGLPPQKKKNNKKTLIIAIVIAAIAAAIIAGIAIYKASGKATPEKSEAAYQKMQEAVIDGKVDPYANTIDFEALWEINEDVFAWITVPGTTVNYPILYSMEKDDAYYLNTTIDGKSGMPGSIYMEKYNAVDLTDPISILYGHTLMESPDVMFGQLHKYNEKKFLEEYPYIYIYLPEATLKYQVFAAAAFDDRYLLTSYDIYSETDFNQYLSDLNACMTKVVDEDVNVQYGDYVVTLSTCINEYPEQRWLVNGVMVDYIVKDGAKDERKTE